MDPVLPARGFCLIFCLLALSIYTPCVGTAHGAPTEKSRLLDVNGGDDTLSLLQTEVRASRPSQEHGPSGLFKKMGPSEELNGRVPMSHPSRVGTKLHARQMRGAIAVTVLVYIAYLLFQFSSLGGKLYDYCFDSDAGLKSQRKEGCARFLMQFTALTWKNIAVNSRTELPMCLRWINGCCCQMLCSVAYIFLICALPMLLVHALGADRNITTDFEMQWGRDYQSKDLTPQPDMGALLYQQPSFLGASGKDELKEALQGDPLEALWHPMGLLPQGACFCRTLGIIGPRAADFKDFANRSYTKWLQSRSGNLSSWQEAMGAGEARYHCPSNYTGTLFRVFPNMEEVDMFVKGYDYPGVRQRRSEYSPDRLCGVVKFENDPVNSAVPRFVVRTNVTGMDRMRSIAKKTVTEEQRGLDKRSLSWYLQSGFLSMQDLVQRFMAEERLGNESLPQPHFVPLPSAPYHSDVVKQTVSNVLIDPNNVSCVYMYTAMLIAFFMIRERNSRQKELMRLMGLHDFSLVLAWVALFALTNLVNAFGCTFLVYSALIEKSDYVILFLVFYLAGMGTLAIGMVVSSLFSSDRLGALLAFVVYIVTGLIYHGVVPAAVDTGTQSNPDNLQRMDDVDGSTLHLVSIFPNIAFVLCLKTYFELDRRRSGCTWRQLHRVVDKFSMGSGLGMLLLDILFWLLVHLYLEQVIPHQVGTTRPWYFPFTRSFWRDCFGIGGEDHANRQEAGTVVDDAPQEGKLFEPENTAHLAQLRQRKSVISVRGLRKTFTNASGAQIRAVDGLSLTMYEGECFCLLGHNGAGKTTAMGMITGMIMPTSGEVNVLGYRMPEEKAAARHDMGFCMQQNVLWDTLTVEEHVLLFGALMGLTPSAARESCSMVLAKVELVYKQQSFASALSGGMKRKLNVALALVGESRVLLLDEPTAGMDPHTRRRLWGLLKQSRAGRIVCLTTHYMDEADELGDRVSIMVHGKAACCGTNAFLKRQLGCGYLITFVKLNDQVGDDAIVKLVQRHCGQDASQEISSVGRELRLQIPFMGAKYFPPLMRELDKSLGELGLESYGIGVSDLEDVFLRVANGEIEDTVVATPQAARQGRDTTMREAVRLGSRPEPTVTKQFVGLFQRRVRYGIRDSRMFCCQLIVPTFVMVLFLALAKHAVRKFNDFDALQLDTSGWTGPMLVSVGVVPDTGVDAATMRRRWAVRNVPGVSDVAFSRNISASNSTLPKKRRERWSQEMNGASWAYRLEFGSQQERYNKSDADQFGSILYAGNGVTIYPNTSSSYSAPVLFNLHFVTAAKSITSKGAQVPLEQVEVLSNPLEPTKHEHSVVDSLVSFAMGVIVMIGYSFIGSGISCFIVMEKELEVKHQLLVSGANRFAYWLSNFVFDSVFGLVSFVGTLIVLAIFGSNTWCSFPAIQATVVLLLLFVPAVSTFAYFWSTFFSSSGSALVFVLLYGLFVGMLGLEISTALTMIPGARSAGEALLWLSRALIPSVCVGDGLSRLAMNKGSNDFFHLSPFSGHIFGTDFCPPVFAGTSMPCIVNAGDSCAMLFFDAIFYAVLCVLGDWICEHPGVSKFFQLRADPSCPWELRRQEDEKVLAEKERVAKLDPASQILVVSDVSKVYRTSKADVHAVRGVSFAVEAGSVFGLLGTNGAGKTTTFKMICGQVTPSKGRIFVKGIDVAKDLHGVRKHIGYCPQFDALLDLMTVREHIELYARLKGLTGEALEAELTEKIETLRLAEYTESRAGQLSGGNKRKLSTAIALVGEPEVIFLDEPSAGMDPLARRRMWDVIQNIALRRRSSAVVLTTHSMEEADALCTRIGIQASGQLRCLGSPQQLKEWYSTGLELNLRVEAPAHTESEALCKEWLLEPEAVCDMSKAQHLATDFFASCKLEGRAPPFANKADTLVAVALAEWCLQELRAESIAAFLVDTCGGKEHACCVERSAGSLRYKLKGSCAGGGPRPYSELFEMLEKHRSQLHLADFQLSQGTLEQTFNRLAAEDIALREGDDTDDEGPANP